MKRRISHAQTMRSIFGRSRKNRHKSLEEERQTDLVLTRLAEKMIVGLLGARFAMPEFSNPHLRIVGLRLRGRDCDRRPGHIRNRGDHPRVGSGTYRASMAPLSGGAPFCSAS